jgi:hypothetical protein
VGNREKTLQSNSLCRPDSPARRGHSLPEPAKRNWKPATTLHNLSSEDVASRTIQRRAVEAVIWSTPAVNFDRMDQAMVNDAKAGEGNNNL